MKKGSLSSSKRSSGGLTSLKSGVDSEDFNAFKKDVLDTVLPDTKESTKTYGPKQLKPIKILLGYFEELVELLGNNSTKLIKLLSDLNDLSTSNERQLGYKINTACSNDVEVLYTKIGYPLHDCLNSVNVLFSTVMYGPCKAAHMFDAYWNACSEIKKYYSTNMPKKLVKNIIPHITSNENATSTLTKEMKNWCSWINLFDYEHGEIYTHHNYKKLPKETKGRIDMLWDKIKDIERRCHERFVRELPDIARVMAEENTEDPAKAVVKNLESFSSDAHVFYFYRWRQGLSNDPSPLFMLDSFCLCNNTNLKKFVNLRGNDAFSDKWLQDTRMVEFANTIDKESGVIVDALFSYRMDMEIKPFINQCSTSLITETKTPFLGLSNAMEIEEKVEDAAEVLVNLSSSTEKIAAPTPSSFLTISPIGVISSPNIMEPQDDSGVVDTPTGSMSFATANSSGFTTMEAHNLPASGADLIGQSFFHSLHISTESFQTGASAMEITNDSVMGDDLVVGTENLLSESDLHVEVGSSLANLASSTLSAVKDKYIMHGKLAAAVTKCRRQLDSIKSELLTLGDVLEQLKSLPHILNIYSK